MRWLAIGQHPDVRGNTRIVEHIERQRDNRLQIVILDNPTADIALPLPLRRP